MNTVVAERYVWCLPAFFEYYSVFVTPLAYYDSPVFIEIYHA